MASIAVLDVAERIAPFEEPEVSDAMTTATSRAGAARRSGRVSADRGEPRG